MKRQIRLFIKLYLRTVSVQSLKNLIIDNLNLIIFKKKLTGKTRDAMISATT